MKKHLMTLMLCGCCLLVSCSGKSTYSNTLTAEQLAQNAQNALAESDYLTAEPDYLNDYISLPEPLPELTVRIAADGNNLNEFGIWHIADGQSGMAKTLFRAYLDASFSQNRAFYDSYIPQETPKLRDAEVRVFGNYVAYAIMDAEDRNTFFRTIEQSLSAHSDE